VDKPIKRKRPNSNSVNKEKQEAILDYDSLLEEVSPPQSRMNRSPKKKIKNIFKNDSDEYNQENNLISL
jgi:hypothetical protein